MLDRRPQIRMSIIGLCVQERFNFLEACLNGRKKRGCIQAVSFRAKHLPVFSLEIVATFSRLHTGIKSILSAIRRI